MSTAPPPEREPKPGGPGGPDEPPPILGAWLRVYAAVAAFLATQIALFTWFTKTFE